MLFKTKRPGVQESSPLRLVNAPASGLFSGTRISTPGSWRAVEELEIGDKVSTLEQGDQEIIGLIPGVLNVGTTLAAARQWPLMVPAGALGDNDALLLAPHMRLVVDDAAVGLLFGELSATIRVEALIGYRGIARAREAAGLTHSRLEFEQPVTIILEGGGFLDMPNEQGAYRYPPLNDRQARLLMRHLSAHDQNDPIRPTDARWI